MKVDDQDLELTVYFDGDCGLCKRIARWLETQPKNVPVHCVPAQSQQARELCPFDPDDLLARVTVIASDGAVYRGTNAWLVCLWALRNYRSWSLRLSSGALRPLAEVLFASITGLASMSRRRG